MLSTAVPKPAPRWQEKQRKRADEARQIKACYAQVDRRDGHVCRICGRRVGGLAMDQKAVHHHMVYRSRGGAHEPGNVLTICPACDDAIHREGRVAVTGNADARDERGRLCGVQLQRLTESGWQVERWI